MKTMVKKIFCGLLCALFAFLFCYVIFCYATFCEYKKVSTKQAKNVTFWAIWEDGHRVKTGDEYGVYPIFEPNDVASFYPYFIAEKEVDFRWGKLTLRSEPLIFSENPAIQGKYGRRMVYYVER